MAIIVYYMGVSRVEKIYVKTSFNIPLRYKTIIKQIINYLEYTITSHNQYFVADNFKSEMNNYST